MEHLDLHLDVDCCSTLSSDDISNKDCKCLNKDYSLENLHIELQQSLPHGTQLPLACP